MGRIRRLSIGWLLIVQAAAGGLPQSARADDLGSYPTVFRWSGQGPSQAPPKRDEPLQSDRPDFTESSTTVGAGITQIEMGYTYIYENSANVQTKQHSFPETLFRVGMLADWLEARIAYNHASQGVTVGGVPFTSATGAEDLYLGFKIALTEQDAWLPEMAVIPQMTVPVGHEQFTSSIVCPGLNWLYGWEINDFITTAGSTQFNKAVDDDGTVYTEWAQSWTIGYTLGEHWGAFTEVFALMPSGASTELPEYYFDAGFTFPVTNDLQFDLRGGVGLNEPADDYFTGAGLVVRF